MLKNASGIARRNINDYFEYGKSLQSIVNRIPILCMINLEEFTILPRSKYLLLEYTPNYQP